MKKILVTGATGFVGKAIVDELLKHGHDVYTCARRATADLPNYHSVDITSNESVVRLFQDLPPDLDVVIHSAGLAHQFRAVEDPSVFTDVNAKGTFSVLKWASDIGVKKFIQISSISVYGDAKPNPTDEEYNCLPSGDYAESKYAAEISAGEAAKECGGIELVILRLATVYGPGDVGNVRRLIKLIDSGRFFWTGKGDNSKSLIFNEDAARAVRLVAEAESHDSHVYNVTDDPHTMREIVEAITNALGKKIPRLSVSPSLITAGLGALSVLPVIGRRAKDLSRTLKKWQSDDVLSGKRIERELGFKPAVSLTEGIKREIEWYKNGK